MLERWKIRDPPGSESTLRVRKINLSIIEEMVSRWEKISQLAVFLVFEKVCIAKRQGLKNRENSISIIYLFDNLISGTPDKED